MATPLFGIKELTQGQSQKELTHNEALRLIDAVMSKVTIDNALTTPPATPAEGDMYIVAAGGTGDWLGHDTDLAIYVNSVWLFVTPPTDFIVYNTSTAGQLKFNSTWQVFSGGGGGGGGSYTYVNANASQAVSSWQAIVADSSAGIFTLTLPSAPAVGDQIMFLDAQNTWAVNNVTIAGNGNNIQNSPANLILNINDNTVVLAYINTIKGWAIIN